MMNVIVFPDLILQRKGKSGSSEKGFLRSPEGLVPEATRLRMISPSRWQAEGQRDKNVPQCKTGRGQMVPRRKQRTSLLGSGG